MNKIERIHIARRATAWLKTELPEGLDSHQDDLDNAEVLFRDEFPNVDLGPHDDGFTAYLWDSRKGWVVSWTDVTEI